MHSIGICMTWPEELEYCCHRAHLAPVSCLAVWCKNQPSPCQAALHSIWGVWRWLAWEQNWRHSPQHKYHISYGCYTRAVSSLTSDSIINIKNWSKQLLKMHFSIRCHVEYIYIYIPPSPWVFYSPHKLEYCIVSSIAPAICVPGLYLFHHIIMLQPCIIIMLMTLAQIIISLHTHTSKGII